MLRTKWAGVVCAAMCLVMVAMTGCTSSPPGGSPTPTPTPTPTPGGDNDTFRLTLNMRSGNGEALGMNVRVMVGDMIYTRANAPYTNGNIAKANFTSDEDPDTFPLDVPAGKTVTLIATESKGSLASAFAQEDAENFINPFHVEFINWEGDDEAHPEAGVATLTMDSDKTVSAIYAQMPRVIIRKFDENNAQMSGGCLDLVIDPTPRLSLPGDDDLAGETENLCCCNADEGDIFLIGQVKTGTQVMFTANDSNLCDTVSGVCGEEFLEWRGSAALCGASRECELTVGVDVDASAVWKDNTQ